MKNNNLNTPTAIFIDGSWLYATTKRINIKVDYAKFFNVLRKKFGVKTDIYYYGLVDPINNQQKRFYRSLQKIGYIIHCIKIRKVGDRVISSGLDISLVIDAMRILPSLKNLVLISGDGDFVALLQQANQIRVNTHVIALPFSIGYFLRKVANNFLNLETLITERKSRASKIDVKIETFTDQNYIKKYDSFRSYIKLRDLMKSAKDSITIIDSYIDDQILLMIQLLHPKIKKNIVTDTSKITPADFFTQVQKLKNDGHLIDIYGSKKFHDRFIRIDDIWWHSGHSFKNLGEKDSMFNKVNKKTVQNINNGVAEVIKK